MSEVRTTSATGGQKGVKPERYALLPRPGLDAIARVFGFGESKYAAHNWRKGYEWSKSIDALMRHVTAFNDGETLDPESGESHLAHAGFHILVLLTWLAEQGEGGVYDDRYAAPVEDPVKPLEDIRISDATIEGFSGPLTRIAERVTQFVNGVAPPRVVDFPIPDGDAPSFTTLDESWALPDSIEFTLHEVPRDVLRLAAGLPIDNSGYYDPEADVRAVRRWYSEQMVDLIRLAEPTTEPPVTVAASPLHPDLFEIDGAFMDRVVRPIEEGVVSEAWARFVAGPHGVEDHDDSMTVRGAHAAPLVGVVEVDDGQGRREPRTRPFDRVPSRTRNRSSLTY